ncbi:50S ribosomal protein L13 [Planctomycetota bacterium]
MNCYQASTADVERTWWVVDAEDQVLGRLAARIARVLMGKVKPTYTPHIDCGDYVVVHNASKIAVTGQKKDRRVYTRYSGYPSGLKRESLGAMLARKPEEVLRLAVRRMLPKTRLGRKMLKKLKVHDTLPAHGYQAQCPQPLRFEGRK